MNSIVEHRKYPRKEIQLGILFKHGMEWFPATIIDLSERGLSFETEIVFNLRDMCHIYFSESKEVTSSELKGLVVRCQDIEECSPTKYLIGVELIDANDQYVSDVKSLFQVEGSGLI
ncbi:MAG: PilZ domain-containing protein [Nitrospinales bacterium]